jgi:hypothetical protein
MAHHGQTVSLIMSMAMRVGVEEAIQQGGSSPGTAAWAPLAAVAVASGRRIFIDGKPRSLAEYAPGQSESLSLYSCTVVSATVYVCAPTVCPATTTAAPGVTVYIRAPAACYHEYSLSSCKNEDNTATIMVSSG